MLMNYRVLIVIMYRMLFVNYVYAYVVVYVEKLIPIELYAFKYKLVDNCLCDRIKKVMSL